MVPARSEVSSDVMFGRTEQKRLDDGREIAFPRKKREPSNKDVPGADLLDRTGRLVTPTNRFGGENVEEYPSCFRLRLAFHVVVMAIMLVECAPTVTAQQKGQWVLGQSGLDAGILPDAGFTYANLTINYSADTLRNSSGDVVHLNGNYSFWAVENVFYYVPPIKILGGRLATMALLPVANGSVTLPDFEMSGQVYGFADTYFQPLTLGWNFKYLDTWVGYGFTAPTGSYTPGASDNVGSGYWGNNIVSAATLYLTKSKGTTANLATDWETHGQTEGSSVTPGQAFTMEWGIGHYLPLDNEGNKILELGVVGYDQWQVSANGGTLAPGIPASSVPYYSVHAIGLQTNFVLPAKGLSLFFKYEPEYLARARPQGRTIVFGGSWTLRFPKAKPPQQGASPHA